MTDVTYGHVVKLAEKLSPVDQQALIFHLQALARQRKLTLQERKSLLEAGILSLPVAVEPSVRRTDSYCTVEEPL